MVDEEMETERYCAGADKFWQDYDYGDDCFSAAVRILQRCRYVIRRTYAGKPFVSLAGGGRRQALAGFKDDGWRIHDDHSCGRTTNVNGGGVRVVFGRRTNRVVVMKHGPS